MSTYNDRILELVKHYRYNPYLYSEEQVDELQRLADDNNVPFNRKTDDFNFRKTMSHLVDGFFEGFTTIPVSTLKGDHPTTTYESIAHSLGHLAGFAPGIISAPLKLGAKGLAKIGFGEQVKDAFGKITYKGAARYVDDAAEITREANHWSIPMIFGDIGKRKFQQGLEVSKLQSLDFLKKGAGARSVLEQAVHLGTASAVSSVWKGPDEMMHSAYSGAIAGGAFGGLGEIRMIGNYLKSTSPNTYRKGEQRVKSAIGAAMLGVPTALQGEPIEMIMYQTLLGGYFGYGSRPSMEAEGGKFIQRLQYEGDKKFIFRPTQHPRWDKYSKGAQEYIKKEVTEGSKDYLYRQFNYLGYDKDYVNAEVTRKARESEGLGANDPLPQEKLDAFFRSEAHDFYMSGPGSKKSSEIHIHKDLTDALSDAEQQMDANDPVDLTPTPKKKKGEPKTNAQEMKERENDVDIFAAGYDPTTGNVTIIGGIDRKKIGFRGDYEGTVNGESRVNRPSDVLENTEYITWDGVFIKDPKTGKYTKYKPLSYGTTKNASTNWKTSTTKNVDTKLLWKIESKLHESGRYLYGGIKDKGILTIREYHADANRYTNEQLIKALSERDSTRSYEQIRKSLLDSRNEWMSYYKFDSSADKQYIIDRHDKSWRSNILAEAERNGLYDQKDLSNIHKLMTDGYSKNVVDWNKREQLYNDKSMPLPKDSLGTLKSAIFTENFLDVAKNQYINIKGEREYFDSDTDGTIYFLQKDIDMMYDRLGLKEKWKDSQYSDVNPSMIKPVIIVKTPMGTMIVKAAGRGASKPLEQYMINNGLRSVIMKSATKHTGSIGGPNGERFNTFNIDKLKQRVYEHEGNLNTLDINEADIRINLGTFENPATALKKQKIARQLASNLNQGQAGGALEALWKEVYLPNIEGDPNVNKAIKNYVESEGWMQKTFGYKKFKVDDLDINIIHDILTKHGNTELAKDIARQIARQDKKGQLEDVDNFTPEQYQQYVYRNNRILDSADFSQSLREINLGNSRQFFENVYKKYLVTRAYAPKYKYSSKGWLAPKDPHLLLSTRDIKDGHFMLDRDMGKMTVKYKGKDTKLEEAWNDYVKNGKPKSEANAFDFLVIRVPADSISGTRVLKFDGFTTQKGVSITTNAKDNAYLGGADKDSDSAFLYQNMPRKVVDAVKKQQDQWSKDNRWIDGKSEVFDPVFGASGNQAYSTIESKFSPSMRRIVADSAAKGQKGLGYGVVAKDNLLGIADFLKGKGAVTFSMNSPKGKYLGNVTLELKPNGHNILARLGREVVNRSADAANYPKMIDFTDLPNIMLNSAFNMKGVKLGKKMKEVTYDDLANTSLNAIFDARAKISSSNKTSFPLWQRSINQLNDLNSFPTLSSRVAERLNQAMVDSKGNMKIFNDVKVLENLNKAMSESVKQYIRNKNTNPAYRVLTQLNFKLQAKPYGNYSQMRYKVERDFEQLTSWNAIAKSGNDIYAALKKMGYGDKAIQELDVNILSKIAKTAEIIKKRTRQFHPDSEVKNEFGEIVHSSSEYFDKQVLDYKNGSLNKLVKQYDKRHGKDNLINSDMLHKYFDMWLLSPFVRTKSTDTSFSKIPFQSKSINQKSLEYYTKQHNDLFQSIIGTVTGKKPKEKALFDMETFDYKTPKKQAQEDIIDKAINKTPDVKKNPNESLSDLFRRKALTKDQFHLVMDFERRLDNNPHIRDNFKDFYENFIIEVAGGPAKDISLIDIKDINAINRYMKDMDNRFTKAGTKLPDFVWRASPEYVDLYMRNFENKYFATFQENVKTKEGFVKRTIRKYTGTLGIIKDYVHKTTSEIERQTGKVEEFNDRAYIHRNLPVKEAEGISELIFLKREGVDYKSTDLYKQLNKKSFNIRNKERSLDEIIERDNNKYTEQFENFSKKYIHATDNKGNYIDFSQIDVKNKYGKYSKYLSWDKDGKFNAKNFEKAIMSDVMKGKGIPEVPIEVILRASYELMLETQINNKTYKKSMSLKQRREQFRKKVKFNPIGRFEFDTYIPHINFGRNKKSREVIDKWINERVQEVYDKTLSDTGSVKKAERMAKLKRLSYEIMQDRSTSEDLGMSSVTTESVMYDFSKMSIKDIDSTLLNHRPGSALERHADMPGWDRTHNAIDFYKKGIFTAMYKAMSGYQSKKSIMNFEKEAAFGKNTADWALYLKSYYRDSMGLPTIFGNQMHKFLQADPKFKRRGFYLTSDQAVIEANSKINNWFKKHGRQLPWMNTVPEMPKESLKKSDPVLYEKMYQAHMSAMSRVVHNMGRVEAKFNLLTILGHPKLYVGNLFGGTTNTITRAGLKNFMRSYDKKWIKSNLLVNEKGEYRLRFKDGSSVKNKKDLDKWIAEKGIIESFITNELNLNIGLRDARGIAKQNLKDFSKDLKSKLKRDPDMNDNTILELAKKYKVDKLLIDNAAVFMQASERKLRRDSFLSHAIKYMEVYGKDGLRLNLDDPAVMEAGLKGVEATQFVYHSSFRPGYMRTSLGKVLSRFKLFVFNSVRVRKEMLRKAKYYGFEPGTEQFERFKTDFQINMFIAALASAFAYSLFDTSLPPPYDWVQETGEWLLGDKKERDKAFFGQWPYPVAPLNIVTPPVARLPMSFFGSLINNDWDRFMDYQIYTMFPFGRMIRSADKIVDEPYGTIEGRAMQQIFGLPLDTVRSKIKRANVLAQRKELIDKELSDMTEGE